MRTAWISARLSASRACWNSSVNVVMKWSGGAVGLEEFLGDWGGFQFISEVTDVMVRCWSVAKRAVRLGAG